MLAVRRLLAQRSLATLLVAATLFFKLLVPTGYMIGDANGRMTIELCSGVAGTPMAMPGMQGGQPGHGSSHDHGKVEMPCAFSSLAAASLDTIDPIQLVALIAFVMTALPAPVVRSAFTRLDYLRPPLRGPPAVLR